MDEVHGFDSLPALLRPGTVADRRSRRRPEYDYANGVALHLSEPTALTEPSLRVGDVDFTVRRDGRTVTVHGPDPAEKAGPIVRRADEKNGGSASTMLAVSATVTFTLPDAAQ